MHASAVPTRHRKLADRYWARLATGVLASLLVHGFILSLRLGIPGLGLPGLELPWTERRAHPPELSVRIANPVQAAVETNDATVVRDSTPVQQPQPALQQSSDAMQETEPQDTRTRQAPRQSAPNSTETAKALRSTPAQARATRQPGAPPPTDQSAPAPASAQKALIALEKGQPNVFVVPTPGVDDWWRNAPNTDSTPVPLRPPELAAPPAIAMQTPKPVLETATDPAPAVQKPQEQESFEHPDALAAKEPEPAKVADTAVEQAVHAQGEEIAAQDAARTLEQQEAAQRAQDLETKKQEDARRQQAEEAARLLATQKMEEENAARRAEELAAQQQKQQDEIKRQDEIKKQEMAEAEREARELAARRQAEEITRRQAAALALQKLQEEEQRQAEETRKQEQEQKQANADRQAAELAAHKQAEGLAVRQAEELARQAELAAREIEALTQNNDVRQAATAGASSGNSNSGSSGATGHEAGMHAQSGSGNLASRALEQIGKLDMNRVEPALTIAPRGGDDAQRGSILGNFDHDIGLRMYVEGWRAKIERNGSLNYSQSSKDKAREDPVVTVAIRSDGSVEDIVFNRSSGRADLDEAVRRIVRVNAPYSVFPANLARKYDVIPIRRIWNFDERLHIVEEVHQE